MKALTESAPTSSTCECSLQSSLSDIYELLQHGHDDLHIKREHWLCSRSQSYRTQHDEMKPATSECNNDNRRLCYLKTCSRASDAQPPLQTRATSKPINTLMIVDPRLRSKPASERPVPSAQALNRQDIDSCRTAASV